MELFIQIIIGLLVLMFLVVVHELGHALAARRSGVVVEEFGVGFPPTFWKKKLKNGVLLKLSLLPIGGYVKLKGEHDSADKKGDYGAATYWQKTKILFAGVTMNWLVAVVLFTILALTGMPKVIENQFLIEKDATTVRDSVEIVGLTENYPAQKAGFEIGDQILSVNGKRIETSQQLIDLTKANKNQMVTVKTSRGGVEKTTDIKLSGDASKGYLGASLGQRELIKSTWSAPIVGVVTTLQLTQETFRGLGVLVSSLFERDYQAASEGVAGPVSIVGTILPAAEKAGLTYLIFITAIISLSLAVMNVLPIPALDGGRWATMTVFRLFRKKLTKKIEERIQLVGFSLLMGLVVLVTYVDIARLF